MSCYTKYAVQNDRVVSFRDCMTCPHRTQGRVSWELVRSVFRMRYRHHELDFISCFGHSIYIGVNHHNDVWVKVYRIT